MSDIRIGTPLFVNNTIYFGTGVGTFYAYDLQTGQEKWRYDTGRAVLLAPLVENGRVYFGGESGNLYALDSETGAEIWKFAAGDVEHQIRDKYTNSVPTIQDGIIYFTSEDFNVYALDVETGKEVWRFFLEEETQQVETPIVDGTLYVGSWNGYMFAIDIKTGTEVWRSQTDNYHTGQIGFGNESFIPDQEVPEGERGSNQVPFVTVSPIITNDFVYFVDWTGSLFAVDRQTGEQIWRFKAETENWRNAGSRFYMTLYDDVIYYATFQDKHVYGVDRLTGEQVWHATYDGWLDGPIPGKDHIAFLIEFPLMDNGFPEGFSFQVHALDLNTQEILYTMEDISLFPTVYENTVVYGSVYGRIKAVDIFTGKLLWELEVDFES